MLNLNQGIYVHFLRRTGDNSTIRYSLLARRRLWENVPEDGDKNKFQPSAWAECTGRTNTTNLHHHQEGPSGVKSGGVVRALASNQCGPGLNPGVDAICRFSLLLVLSFAPRGFSPGSPVSPSPQKPTLPNSNSIWNARTRLNEFIWTLKCFVGKKAIYNF